MKEKWPFINAVESHIYKNEISWPKISIVTPSFNQAKYIEETILSIVNQNYPNLEYIIIDGGSTDGSKEIITSYQQHLKYWVSEPDKGQVDAILKGLKNCTGDIFNWINSDDMLAEKSLFKIASAYLANKGVKIIAGGCTHFNQELAENQTTLVRDLTFKGLISEKSYFQQPSQWISLSKIKKLNIDSKLHYSFDWGMILNFELEKSDILYLSDNLSYFREHEDAKTSKASLMFQHEKLEIVKKYQSKTNNLSKKIMLSGYIFKLSNYLKVMDQLHKPSKITFKNFLALGLRCPHLFFVRFYLGHLKKLAVEKKN
ncbi:MAG: glycosyltransferase [Pedobacter sp.]|nr:MAG: glycosyltransferase [Pedobacter sp.]